MSSARIGTFDDLLAITETDMRPLAAGLRDLIFELHPETVEVVRLGDRAATYGVGPKKMSEGYAYILPHSSWINLGFYHGVALSDPNEVLEGTGARMRHVKIRHPEQVSASSIRDLIVASIVERKEALGRA